VIRGWIESEREGAGKGKEDNMCRKWADIAQKEKGSGQRAKGAETEEECAVEGTAESAEEREKKAIALLSFSNRFAITLESPCNLYTFALQTFSKALRPLCKAGRKGAERE
jgi:hypothetical protein